MSLSPKQEQLFKQANKHIPGGVNSPVRAFNGVGGTPVFIEKAKGAYLWDVDGKRYVDYVGSWGPMILGHAHPEIIKASRKRRIAAGSGVTVQEVNRLLKQFEQTQKMMRAITKGGITKMIRNMKNIMPGMMR